MKRLSVLLMLAVAGVSLAGCVVYPARPYYGEVWVPGHYGPHGYWFRGHYS